MHNFNSLIHFIPGRAANLVSSNSTARAVHGRIISLKKLQARVTDLLMLLVITISLGFSDSVAAEVILYGTSTGFGSGGGQGGPGGPGSGTGGGGRSQFHRVDINTGETTELSADIGYGGDANGLAVDSNDVSYAGTGGRGPNDIGRGESPTLLFTIDPMGIGSPAIGPLGIEFGPPQSEGEGPGDGDFHQFGSLRQSIPGWSFDPLSGQLYGITGRGSQLFIADTESGIATRIGTPCDSPEIGAPRGNCRRGNAIAFDDVGINDPLGTLFWGNDVEIAELDPSDGSIVGSPVALDFSVFGPPANPDVPFRVVAMDYHPVTGDLYAAVQQGQADASPPATSTLSILDPRAGTFTIVGEVDSTGVKLDGIAFTSPDYIPPPECHITLDKGRYTDGDKVIADVLRLANPGGARVKTEIKFWMHKPDKPPKSVFNLGGFGGIKLPAGMDVDFGPIKLIRKITPNTPRGTYEFSCRLLDPITGELLWEDRNFFDVEDPAPPPGPIMITEDVWTIDLVDAGLGIYSIFMIADVSPLTVDDLQGLGGRLVWDKTEVILCDDPTFPPVLDNRFISIREVGDGFLKIGDGFQSDTQGEGCGINEKMAAAFEKLGVPNEACVSVTTGGVEYEYCAPLNEIQ